MAHAPWTGSMWLSHKAPLTLGQPGHHSPGANAPEDLGERPGLQSPSGLAAVEPRTPKLTPLGHLQDSSCCA